MQISRESVQGVLKLSDLARRPDFRLGPLSISPSRRRVEGPAGTVHLEPLIMQVFLLLLDARGELVTRDQLFGQVWGGAMVGDDSLNRAIARVRRISAETAPGIFEIETIPRTGYRLIGEIAGYLQDNLAGSQAPPRVSRRTLVGGGVAATAIVGAGGLWWADAQEDREFEELMARGQYGLERSDPGYRTPQYFRRAVALRPGDAEAQGKFAYILAVSADYRDDGGTELEESERAARRALAIDPHQAEARLALMIQQQSMLDFAATEDRIRAVLATAPDNIVAMRQMWAFLQCVGRSRDCLAMIERSLRLYPLAPGSHYPHAQLLWILGRTAEADRVIDRAMRFWPSHRFIRGARFQIYASTGRQRAALAMLENKQTIPQFFSSAAVSLWRVSLTAMDQRSPASVAAALDANVEAAKRDPKLAPQAMQALSMLGDVDSAFDVANDLFVVHRPTRLFPQANRPTKSTAWRFAPWLFAPPIAPMRADPRFRTICDEIGLTEYWAKRGIKPDYQLGIT